MRIASSDLVLSARHALTEKTTRTEQLTVGVSTSGRWEPSAAQIERTRERALSPAAPAPSLLDEYLGSLDPEAARRIRSGAGAAAPGGAATGSPLPSPEALQQALAALGHAGGADLLARIAALAPPDLATGAQPLDEQLRPEDRLKMELIRSAVEAFSGKALHLLDPADLDLDWAAASAPATSAPEVTAPQPVEPAAAAAAEAPSAPVFGLVYTYRDTRTERETTSFAATGVVRTADGQQVSVDVRLTMDRQLTSEQSGQVRAGAALQDPLVVNFDGTAAQLTQRTFAFDLDTDGQEEQIRFVGPGSGFLAQDRNGNGAVDDGAELFGPTTGQGFAELAGFDADGNRFIDEGDGIWDRLRIWERDEGGTDRLVALGAHGIGAIYLGAADTPFQVQDGAGQLQAAVRSTGVYLKEGGGAGTVQQLDLVV